MDILTQALLGATTFAAVKDKELGKKSLAIGAFAGIIPDLDIFLAPFFDPIEFLSVHRSVSHSILLAILLSLGLGYVFFKYYKSEQSLKRWILAFFLAIMTHSILDCCTTYGTKLLSPFSNRLFSTNNIHVFEPIYSLILLIGVMLLIFKTNKSTKRKIIIQITLCFSTLYLAWTFVSKGIANNKFVEELERQEIQFEKFIVSPTPLNCILWHGIAKTEKGYYIATYSLLDKRKEINFYFEKSDHQLVSTILKNRLGKYFIEYTQDFPLIKSYENGDVEVFAIKYGPINYYGVPQFIFPLTFNLNNFVEGEISIKEEFEGLGPLKNYKNLFKRIKGI